MSLKILAINPGSTSTKLAVYENETCVFKVSVKHESDEITKYERIIDQYEFREKAILDALKKSDINLKDLDAVVGRGGMLKPIEGGTYAVNDAMIEYIKKAPRGEHASNLGCVIAKAIGDEYTIPSFIVDPVAVDEMEDIARYTGMPEIRRDSLFHALNQKAVALKAARDLKKPYNKLNLIVAHLGGGISVGAHQMGRVIDVNNALDGDGPMSPERSGSVPLGPLYKMIFTGDYTLKDIQKKNYGQGGLVAYLGTNDGYEIEKRIKDGDEHAKFIYSVMCYQIAKEIGSCATVLKGKVDAIILTGGLAYDTFAINLIKERTEFISPIMVYPGEDEMEALALGGLRVLKGEEIAKEYK
ncbi:butyrate kinase [Liberiplasma polymorphum]|uniref:butyrate kinase n=1 Tax=Liberiplasma polymorphum TaxID=3374570 RepID=UPI003773D646